MILTVLRILIRLALWRRVLRLRVTAFQFFSGRLRLKAVRGSAQLTQTRMELWFQETIAPVTATLALAGPQQIQTASEIALCSEVLTL